MVLRDIVFSLEELEKIQATAFTYSEETSV